MPQPPQNYTPQFVRSDRKNQALKVWLIAGALVTGWVLAILLAPAAGEYRLTGISDPIYGFFGFLCHQMPSRSFFLGEHQFAVCSRCFGVYFGLVFGFAVYPFFRALDEIEPFSRIWLLLALVPMGLDWSLDFLGIWENTHLTRFGSGLILGTACAVYIVPALVELAQFRTAKIQTKRLSR